MKRFAIFSAIALTLTYLATLVMSAGHLYLWYELSLGSLPRFFAIGLAASLEASAFLLSLTSNVLPGKSRWAGPGALGALLLVWVGNYLSMTRAAPAMPAWEIALSSAFIPIGTLVTGKVVGELLLYALEPQPTPVVESAPAPPKALTLPEQILLAVPGSLREIEEKTGYARATILQTLSRLEEEGRVIFDGTAWRAA
ncbi:MAG: hypothetical protein KatS3mg071_1616 [Meiothermus sp.]|nr:MAG: hypothetical protein KatS3mg071_1616 [Meiothermus sp.]